MLQPMLADQEHSTLQGNKNKTELFDVVSHSMEDQENDATSTKNQGVGDCFALDSVSGDRQQGNTHVTSDTQIGPQLAPTKNYSLEENKKTKSCLWMGMIRVSVRKIYLRVVHNLTWQLE